MPLLLLLGIAGKAQQPGTRRAVWHPPTREMVYLQGTDSIFSIRFDNTFYAQLNHEKKKKHKTVRYRLARYSTPVEVSEIPVTVSNNNTLLALRGTLQGDTGAFFSLMLSLQNETPVLEVLVPEIAVNEFSFRLRFFRAAPRPTPITLLKDAPLVTRKRKKYSCRIHVYGNSYRIAFTGL